MPFRRRSRFVRIERTELDGMPVFWTDAQVPFVASIIFRTGRADETLPTAGISHLIEHLVFPARQVTGIEMNGTVTATETMFWAAGPRQRALEAFSEILRGLAELPLERLETERRILQTEAASISGDPVKSAAALRFGVRGHGLPAYEELGLYAVGRDAVEEWWRERFTAENAAIWMAGKPPPSLEVPLLRGERKPMPELTPIADIALPAHNTGGPSGGLSAALLAERSFSISTVLTIAEHRVRQRLRFEQGLTYGTYAAYEPLTEQRAHAVVFADCLDEHAVTARDTLLGALRELASDGPTADELRDDLAGFEAALSEPSEAPGFLYGRALEELIPGQVHTPEELAEGRAAVTEASAAKALAEALGTLILTTPEGAGGTLDDLEPYPTTSAHRVAGKSHRAHGLHVSRMMRKVRLVAGTEGISLISADGEALTVRFAECVAVKRWPGGMRALWSEDGFYIEVSAAHWRNGDEIVRLIDESVPPSRIVPLERELEERAASVEAAGGERVKRNWWTSNEFDELPSVLAEGERVAFVAKASSGWRAGVAAVTDRRVLFLYFDSVLVDVPLEAITDTAASEGSFLKDNSVTITTDDETYELTSIRPKELLPELLQAIKG
jgi:zinc protease